MSAACTRYSEAEMGANGYVANPSIIANVPLHSPERPRHGQSRGTLKINMKVRKISLYPFVARFGRDRCGHTARYLFFLSKRYSIFFF